MGLEEGTIHTTTFNGKITQKRDDTTYASGTVPNFADWINLRNSNDDAKKVLLAPML
uniref:Uncharacterized protein n=1 Tax=Anguilla anguilla TaxID=7936 RepID=A0A0E9PT12_ANGAN